MIYDAGLYLTIARFRDVTLTDVLTPHLFDLSEFYSVTLLVESHRALQQLPVDLSHVCIAKPPNAVLVDKNSIRPSGVRPSLRHSSILGWNGWMCCR